MVPSKILGEFIEIEIKVVKGLLAFVNGVYSCINLVLWKINMVSSMMERYI